MLNSAAARSSGAPEGWDCRRLPQAPSWGKEWPRPGAALAVCPVPGMSQLSPGCPHCPRCTGVEARPPLSPGWGGDSPDRLQPSGCPVGSWLLSFRENRGSARVVALPSAHLPTRIPLDEPECRRELLGQGSEGMNPACPAAASAGLAAESFWFLLAKQRGKSSLCRHIWNTWSTRVGVHCPVQPRVPASSRWASTAQVRTFSPDASKLRLSGGNSGRRLDKDLPSP